jgi:hypothetical protein
MSRFLSVQSLRAESGVVAIALSMRRHERSIADSAQFCRHGRSNRKPAAEAMPFLFFSLRFSCFPGIEPFLPQDTSLCAMKASIHASAPTDEATEKSRFSQPRDQGSCDHQSSKHTPANRSGRVGRSFEPGSCVTDASDLHPEKQESQITCEWTSNRSHEMQSDRTATLLFLHQLLQMRAICIKERSVHTSLHHTEQSRSDSSCDRHSKIYHKAAASLDNGDSSTKHCRTVE